MRPSFAKVPQPFIVGVLSDPDPDNIIGLIRNCEYDGANALDLHLRVLDQKYHNKKDLERIIKSTALPILMLNYRRDNNIVDGLQGRESDEELVATQLMTVEAGASACDIMADIYDPSPYEISYKDSIIDKQKKLIDTIHKKGAEVLMSSHVWEPLKAEQVVEQMKAVESRGCDMVKMAVKVNSLEDQVEAFKTTTILKQEMKVPFVHICIGQYGKLHRFMGPILGSALTFAQHTYSARAHKEQPLIRAVKAVYDNIDNRIARSEHEAGEN